MNLSSFLFTNIKIFISILLHTSFDLPLILKLQKEDLSFLKARLRTVQPLDLFVSHRSFAGKISSMRLYRGFTWKISNLVVGLTLIIMRILQFLVNCRLLLYSFCFCRYPSHLSWRHRLASLSFRKSSSFHWTRESRLKISSY